MSDVSISYRVRETLSEKDILNSISYYLKYKIPYTVIMRYLQARHNKRVKNLIFHHAIEYPFTKDNIVLGFKKEAETVLRKIKNI
jgi:hypothetical protein